MERVVKHGGVEVARFDWVGVRDQDVESAIAVVEDAFKAWPDKAVPTYPRLQLVVRLLSAHVRAGIHGEARPFLTVPRDHVLEVRIEAGFRGVDKLEEIYRREQKARVTT